MTVTRRPHRGRTVPWIFVAGALAACAGKATSERRGGDGGGSPSAGGTPSGGSGASGGTISTGGSSFGGRGGSDGTMGGTGQRGGAAGDAGRAGNAGAAGNAAGGTTAGDGGGEPGGAPSGGEGGGGDCVDVCALRGEACCIPNVECVSRESNCLFEVLAAPTYGAYDYDALVQRVAALPQDLLLSFTLDEVDWVVTDPFPAGRIELHMKAEYGTAHALALDAADTNPFRVSCDGQPLFIGEIYLREGAAAFDSPVIHVAVDEGEPLILRLGARMPSWGPTSFPVSLESRQRLDRPELRAAMCLRGALGELAP